MERKKRLQKREVGLPEGNMKRGQKSRIDREAGEPLKVKDFGSRNGSLLREERKVRKFEEWDACSKRKRASPKHSKNLKKKGSRWERASLVPSGIWAHPPRTLRCSKRGNKKEAARNSSRPRVEQKGKKKKKTRLVDEMED